VNIQDTRAHYMVLAKCVAAFSPDRDTKVGCVIVAEDKREILATGCNRFPEGLNTELEERYQRPEKYKYTEHAERVAIYYAAKHGVALQDSTLYLSYHPCGDCARAIIQAGIQEVVCHAPVWGNEKWDEELRLGALLLSEAGVAVVYVPAEEVPSGT
jgi:dCMP deaminase